MAVNQVVVGNQTLIDLTEDTVIPEKILQGYTAHDRSGEIIEGTCTFDADTSDANANANQIISPYKAYVKGKRIVGTIKSFMGGDKYMSSGKKYLTLPGGYYPFDVTVYISTQDNTNLKPENIREGVTLFGIAGTVKSYDLSFTEEGLIMKDAVLDFNGDTILDSSSQTILSQTKYQKV